MSTDTIQILFQDHHTLILNKPPGIVIHPTYKHTGDTLWDALLLYLAEQPAEEWEPPAVVDDPGWAQAPEAVQQMLREQRRQWLIQHYGLLPKPALLHRLDRDTSGIVALARTVIARSHMVRQFEQRTIHKRYLAVIHQGMPDWMSTSSLPTQITDQEDKLIDSYHPFGAEAAQPLLFSGPIDRSPDDRRRCVILSGGQEAQTYVRVLATDGPLALVDVQPVTGRIHQIRVHLTASGYPIIGDQTYAREDSPFHSAGRQFLHAYQLEFSHYPTLTRKQITAPLPVDMAAWLATQSPALARCAQQFLAQESES